MKTCYYCKKKITDTIRYDVLKGKLGEPIDIAFCEKCYKKHYEVEEE